MLVALHPGKRLGGADAAFAVGVQGAQRPGGVLRVAGQSGGSAKAAIGVLHRLQRVECRRIGGTGQLLGQGLAGQVFGGVGLNPINGAEQRRGYGLRERAQGEGRFGAHLHRQGRRCALTRQLAIGLDLGAEPIKAALGGRIQRRMGRARYQAQRTDQAQPPPAPKPSLPTLCSHARLPFCVILQ